MKEEVRRVWDGTDGQYLSFNFNVMDSSAAPGVTATEPGGLNLARLYESRPRARAGGPTVFDITELCPMFDVSNSTSRGGLCDPPDSCRDCSNQGRRDIEELGVQDGSIKNRRGTNQKNKT